MPHRFHQEYSGFHFSEGEELQMIIRRHWIVNMMSLLSAVFWIVIVPLILISWYWYKNGFIFSIHHQKKGALAGFFNKEGRIQCLVISSRNYFNLQECKVFFSSSHADFYSVQQVQRSALLSKVQFRCPAARPSTPSTWAPAIAPTTMGR